jgi:methionyl-tRNA formyltransferase
MKPATTGFCVAAAGLKGLEFTKKLVDGGQLPACIYSYRQKGESSDAFAALQSLAAQHHIAFEQARSPSRSPSLRLFFVGWQFVYNGDPENVVVFHDSLLPTYRGFAPTVSALIAGEPEIGVTAFEPDAGIDTGPIIRQAAFPVRYPMKIEEALRRQANLMGSIAADILACDAAGTPLAASPQSNEFASHSLWRDQDDYWIDFYKPAEEIMRFIHALGSPYDGARSLVKDRVVRLLDAEVISDDLRFVERHVGKVWRFDGKHPVIVCGNGMIRVTDMRDLANGPVQIDSLRTRFKGRLPFH